MTALARHRRRGESLDELRLREGEASIGLWLPLALGGLMATIVNALRGEKDAPVKLSQILASWCLPTMSEAIKAEEEKQESANLLAGFEALAARFGGVKNGESNAG